MQNKTINELTSLENPRLTDTLPIWDGTEGKTKKVSLAKIPANVITPVDSLPESPNILDRVYRYNDKYYVGNESAQTLTELALKADIPTVVDTVENGNMNPVTSNAVYDRFIQESSDRNTAISNDRTSHFGCNPSGAVSIIGGQTVTSSVSWTATGNGYVYFEVRLTETTGAFALINGVKVWMHFSGANGTGSYLDSGVIVSGFIPIKSGQVFSIVKGYGPTAENICILENANFIPAN